jgi:hypothetical protein
MIISNFIDHLAGDVPGSCARIEHFFIVLELFARTLFRKDLPQQIRIRSVKSRHSHGNP